MKKLTLLTTVLLLASFVFGQVEIKSYGLGFGINKSLIFPSGKYDFERQGFQPKYYGTMCISTGVENLEFQISSSIEKLDFSRPYSYPSKYPLDDAFTPEPDETIISARLYNIDIGMKINLINKEKWAFSSISTFGIIKSWNFFKRDEYVKYISIDYRELEQFSAINFGLNGRFEYFISKKYAFGLDFGINQYYNGRLVNMNQYHRIPTPNNFQLIVTRKINN